MAEESVLPLHWSLPEPSVPRWTRIARGLLVAATIVIAALSRSWISMIVPVSIGLRAWMRTEPEPRSDFGLTYAAAYGASSLLGPKSLGWDEIRHFEIRPDAILLRSHRFRSPLVLRLPDDPDLRERIMSTVERKLAIWQAGARPPEPVAFISASE